MGTGGTGQTWLDLDQTSIAAAALKSGLLHALVKGRRPALPGQVAGGVSLHVQPEGGCPVAAQWERCVQDAEVRLQPAVP